jgi:hypothetical protein
MPGSAGIAPVSSTTTIREGKTYTRSRCSVAADIKWASSQSDTSSPAKNYSSTMTEQASCINITKRSAPSSTRRKIKPSDILYHIPFIYSTQYTNIIINASGYFRRSEHRAAHLQRTAQKLDAQHRTKHRTSRKSTKKADLRVRGTKARV